MKIGFANIFSFRPHVEHLYYLSTLLKQSGVGAYFLTCDSSVSNCYARALKGSSKLKECPKCILGGVRTYPVGSICSISANEAKLDATTLDKLALSSSCTLNRTESEREWNDPEVVAVRRSLHKPIAKVYHSALRWIERKGLDAVVCFNGRMDLPRAVTYACEQADIPFVTHERTWFGDGLQLIPNANCLSIKALCKMASEYADKPLTKNQAKIAGKLSSERFLQRNLLEWRLYNQNPEPTPWPLAASSPRVLVLPSSKNEFAGHEEWLSGWDDNTKALDDLFEAFSIKPGQVVVRCHPNWVEKIGQVKGGRSLALYRNWAKSRGIYFVSSEQRANTYDLIQQADNVVVNGGSSAVEAGVCGKQVICLGPASYEKAGFVRVFRDRAALYHENALMPLDPDAIIRKTLRFIYLRSHRFAQYVDYVRAQETTRYNYYDGADTQRLLAMLQTGEVAPDDSDYASDASEEDAVVEALKRKEWKPLADYAIPRPHLSSLRIHRRFGLRWIDRVRAKLPRGDRG